MIHCSKCSYAWNPDTASNCVQCKAPLAAEVKRGSTDNEIKASDNQRRQTVAEGVSSGVSAPPMMPKTPERKPDPKPEQKADWKPNSPPERTPEPFVQPDSQPRWSDSQAADRAERRRTVFAGTPASPETPASENSSAFTSGQRRPQTVAVDPSRKIVGVLITYSWQDQGQVFPILEGRNLIGKDPNQSDICIPQDQTLSAVNTFITFRRNFIIGDKVSMSGTDVDGEPIETEFVPLRNYAKIRTGSTHWTFVAIQPSSQQPGEASATEN